MSAPKPIPYLLDVAPYVGGESGIVGVDRVIKLAANEGAFGPSAKTIEAITKAAGEFHRYPDGDFTALRTALAEKHNLPIENLICGSGSDELISLLCRAYVQPGEEILISAHGFAMYPIYGKTVGASIVAAPEQNITTDVDALLERVTDKTKICFIAVPNNPTGTYIPASEIKRLRENLRDDILLVVDMAYAEYVNLDDYSPGAEFASGSDNVVMLRTFSKMFGMGGMRLGWGYCPEGVIDVLNRLRSPFNVSYPSQAAGIAALQDDEFVQMSREHNDKWLNWTTETLRDMGITVPDSVCNFILARFSEERGRNVNAEAADEFLKSKGIIVRRMGGYGLPDALRITIGLEDEMHAVADALNEFMRD